MAQTQQVLRSNTQARQLVTSSDQTGHTHLVGQNTRKTVTQHQWHKNNQIIHHISEQGEKAQDHFHRRGKH